MATTTDKSVTLEVPPNAKTIHDTFDSGYYYLLLGLSEDMNAAIEDLSLRYDCSKAEVINMAIGFFRRVSDAAQNGKRIGIVEGDQELETEFTGFH